MNEATRPATTAATYAQPWLPYVFDTLMGTLYLPVGKLRLNALLALGVGQGTRVLELGCGTGGVTRLLLRAGAEVTAVDQSQQMLGIARRRAPNARFVCEDIVGFSPGGPFDLVLCAFVLHELEAEDRVAVLARAAQVLAPHGQVGILEHGLVETGFWAEPWRHFIEALEPPSARALLHGSLATEAEEAGLNPEAPVSLATGRAQLIRARPG